MKLLKLIGGVLILALCCIAGSLYAQSLTDASMEMARERFKRGIHLFNRYSYLGAVEHFRSALTVYPQYHLAREYLARSYRLSGYADEALTEWELLYDISGDISVKNKIDMMRYMRSGLPGEDSGLPEYVEISQIYSRDLSYYHFPYPTDITVDEDKNLYVTSFNTGKIIKLGYDGKGRKTERIGKNARIYGIDYRRDELLFSDFAHDRIYLTNEDFEEKVVFGSSGDGAGQFHGIQGVAFDEEGNIYAVDSGNCRIQKFNHQGTYLLQFGSEGQYDGELNNPTDVAVYNNRVYVTDTGNSRVLVFDTSGNYLNAIANEYIISPRGIQITSDRLYISDADSGLVLYDTKTGMVKQMESWERGEEEDSFSRLYSSAIDRDGFLYLLDHDRQRVITFSDVRKTYTNIDVEIRSVDTGSFPSVAFYISVRDREGKPLYSLQPEDFTVIEDNAHINRLSIDYLKNRKRKSTAVFCIDRSASMEKWHDELQWSADFYLSSMKRDDAVKIVNVNSTDWVGNDFDWSRRRALRAIGREGYTGTPALGRVLYNAISNLVDVESSRGVVLFTDGQTGAEGFSQYSPEVVTQYARIHYIPVYIVSLDRKNAVLESIAEQTGGQLLLAREVQSMGNIYDSLRGQEEYRYVVVYESFKDRERFGGWWSDVTIDIDSQGRRGREWGGYFVP